MDGTTVEQQKLIEAASTLPDEALLKLANFLDYLRYKSVYLREPDNNASSFLLAVAGLGHSGQTMFQSETRRFCRIYTLDC